MSTPRASYRIELRNSKGKPSNIRYAQTFNIWYGRRRILSAQPFPKYAAKSFTKETTRKKKNYLERNLKSIDKQRVLILEERRARAAVIRAEKAELKAKAKAKALREKTRLEKETLRLRKEALKSKKEIKKLKAEKQELDKEKFLTQKTPVTTNELVKSVKIDPLLREIQTEQINIANKEYPDWSSATTTPGVETKTVKIEDILHVPYRPKNEVYRKALIEKIVSQPFEGTNHTSTLDFTLIDSLLINTGTFYDAAPSIYATFIPHLFKFFNDIKSMRSTFIMRLKFRYPYGDEGKYFEQGISVSRFQTFDFKDIERSMIAAYNKLLGPMNSKGNRTKNYLEGNQDVFITGFTLEAGEIGEGPLRPL